MNTPDRSLTVLLVALVLGCSPQSPVTQSPLLDGSTGDASATPLTFEEFVARSNVLTCRYMLECCRPDERSSTWTDQASCEAEGSSINARYIAFVRPSLDAGRVRFDPEAAERMLAAVEDLSCVERGSLAILPEGWELPLVPLLVDGESCTNSLECVSTLCAASESGESHCAPQPLLGEPCPDGSCAEGSYCHITERICLSQRGEGEPCSWSGVCERPLYCNGDGDLFSDTGTCVPYDQCLGT